MSRRPPVLPCYLRASINAGKNDNIIATIVNFSTKFSTECHIINFKVPLTGKACLGYVQTFLSNQNT